MENRENIAFQKPAYQSSTFMGSNASNSVDGSYSQVGSDCAHGDSDPNTLSWLTVDLLDEYYVSEVILTPRDSPG